MIPSPSVGRSWYIRLTRGILNGSCEIGTHHIDSGTQVWAQQEWHVPLDPMTVRDVLDELYVALMQLMEAQD